MKMNWISWLLVGAVVYFAYDKWMKPKSNGSEA